MDRIHGYMDEVNGYATSEYLNHLATRIFPFVL